MYGVLTVLGRKCHICSSTILVCPHQRRRQRRHWRVSADRSVGLLAVGETLVSTQWDCIVHPPFWTNKIRVKMKSIITADIFISGLPYLITNFFQGFLEEFILWASLSMLLRMCCLVMYTLLPEGRGCVIAVSLIAAHCLSSFLVLCLFQ